jgi:hypothetical protein
MPPPRRAPACAIACLCGLLSGACSSATLDLFDPDLGLLGHWALDESQPGSPAADASGFGHPGTPAPDPPVPTRDVPPVHFADPYSLSFNGQDQWVSIGNPPLLNLGGPITVAAWVRAGASDGIRDVVAHGWRHDPGFDLALRLDAGAYEFTMWDGSIDHAVSAPIPAAQAGAWVHLCGTFDGAQYALYVDGTLVATRPDTAAPPAGVDTTWTIAGQPADRQFLGEIDDVRLYARALAPWEVAALARR